MGHHDHATHETGNTDLYTKRSVTWCTHKSHQVQHVASVHRFLSVAGHILGIRRTRLSNENYESMLFAKVNFDLYDIQHVAGNKRLKL